MQADGRVYAFYAGQLIGTFAVERVSSKGKRKARVYKLREERGSTMSNMAILDANAADGL